MIDLKLIRKDREYIANKLKVRNISNHTIRMVYNLDEKKRNLQHDLETIKAEKNEFNKEIIKLPKDKKAEKIKEMSNLVKKESKLEEDLQTVSETLDKILRGLPNIPADDVPIGKDELGNKIIKKEGLPRKFSFPPLDHLTLGQQLDIIDVEKATQASGKRFGYLKNEAALLQFALIQLAFSVLLNEQTLKKIANKNSISVSTRAFQPIIPPVLVKEEILEKMARLEPRDERYFIPNDNLFLVGSAEHSLGPLQMDNVISEDNLPLRYLGYSSAFRREAGSYGKDTRGIFRVHQFDKLEMETFCLPENSIAEQDFIIAIQEYLMQLLKIPYQIVKMCTGDMTTPDARQVDIEAWIPSENRYRETHTSDLTTDYQSRRLNIRYKKKSGEKGFVHMNDATVFAVGRTLIAIIENYQETDGSVRIPEALHPYMQGITLIQKKT